MPEKKSFKKLLGPALLALAAIIWGVSFVTQSEGGTIGSFTFQGARNTLALLSIGLVTLIRDRAAGKRRVKGRYAGFGDFLQKNRAQLKAGVLCGLALTVAVNMQQIGIDMNGTGESAGRAGFLTALYIVLVPVFGVFLKKKVTPKAWFSVAVAVVGLYLISVKPGAGAGLRTGDVLLILCAFFFAFQILTIDSFSQQVDGLYLSCTEFLIATVLSVICMFVFERPDPALIRENWLMIAYSGVMSGCAGYTLQILGQKYTPPVLASLLMSMESVFSAVSDWILRGNTLSPRELVGCGVMFAAIIIAQLPEFHVGGARRRADAVGG